MYRCLTPTHGDAERLLDEVRGLVSDHLVLDVKSLGADRGAVGIRRGRDGALVYVQDLSESERAWFQEFGDFRSSLAVRPMERTPESVGVCWDIVVALNTFSPTPVWISNLAYHGDFIRKFAPLRFARFSDGAEGSALSAEEFAKLVETPG
jgi:hypothetical protein